MRSQVSFAGQSGSFAPQAGAYEVVLGEKSFEIFGRRSYIEHDFPPVTSLSAA